MTAAAGARCAYLVVSAAPPVLRIEEFVTALTAEGWSVCVIATPNAASWIDLDAVAAATGCVTRSAMSPPLRQESLPRAEVVVAAPLTFNSINKWATGISDSFALGVLNEMLGVEVPVLAVPCVKASLREHPAYGGSVARLVGAGVVMVDPDSVTVRDEDGLMMFDWKRILSRLRRLHNSPVED
ncbi:flavoprotein [Actinoalloteichus caeruleus]|uniref:flavoprotein n=1 Tax=Actinoalloteichus cyanogriseus TaxID=2893586 RepID=UPI003AAED847